MSANNHILEIALPIPLRRTFDYLIPEHINKNLLLIGMRVDVPFGRRKHQAGIIVAIKNSSELEEGKLKPIHSILDKEPIFNKQELELFALASRYYQHPFGEVLFNALPTKLRKAEISNDAINPYWQLSQKGLDTELALMTKAPKQQALLAFFKKSKQPLTQNDLSSLDKSIRNTFSDLKKKQLIEISTSINTFYSPHTSTVALSEEQRKAVDAIKQYIHEYQCFLLDGVTGSGKTEVYLDVFRHCLEENKQVLLLTPEIGLTPQVVKRAEENLGVKVYQYHSKVSEGEKLECWQKAKNGQASIIIGTRSAIWLPLKKPGVIIIDEEHDLSYKQQDGFRYSARDIGILKAQKNNIPIVLGSATPSLESLGLCANNKSKRLVLTKRAGNASKPNTQLIDLRQQVMQGPLSQQLLKQIQNELENNHQVLLFLNRRGYATQLLCHDCGWICKCPRCDIAYTFHKQRNQLICHHCDKQQAVNNVCSDCHSSNLTTLGHGTERIEELLNSLFPENTVLRIDYDTTRKKSAMQDYIEKIHSGEGQILLGTQMLAKGHHFPNLSLVAVLDADRGLHSFDYRASERLAQLLVQVSGRAGRAKTQGKVIIQTYHPDHMFFKDLFNLDYFEFAQKLLEERKEAELPPYHYQALLRAEANQQQDVIRFLNMASHELSLHSKDQVLVFGPFPAPMERKQGRYRMQVMLQSASRNSLHKYISPVLLQFESHTLAKKVRWSIDIDPQDIE